MLNSLLIVSLALLGFALSGAFLPALIAMAVVGLGLNVNKILNQTLLQALTPRQMMGRVLGVYQMDKGLQPVGAMVLGSVATVMGAPMAVGAAAFASALFVASALILWPSLRKL